MENRKYVKPKLIAYRFVQMIAFFFSVFVYRRKILRNEIRRAKGPFVVIANHQAAYDFANLIGTTRRRMSFVLSSSFYQSLPIQKLLDACGVIPKQQFQTAPSEMKRMRAVIETGQPLVIYPAGLMCEDGISTPIPGATYKLLRWLGVDVYMARTSGTYFVQSKWAHGFRPGRTYLDIYRLFTAQELSSLPAEEIRRKTEEALQFDAYRDQERFWVKYRRGSDLNGLENVLYACPHCGKEFSIHVRNENTIFCEECGFEEEADEYALLHNRKGIGQEVRYVSDWSRQIFSGVKEALKENDGFCLSESTKIHTLDERKHRFREAGSGILTLTARELILQGEIDGEPIDLHLSVNQFPTLPFVPGKQLELQNKNEIIRCVLDDGRKSMKLINCVKALYELNQTAKSMRQSG